MMKYLDAFLDRITMYRLVLYVLIALVGIATILAALNLLRFSPFALLLSAALLIVICWAMNTIFAFVFKVPANLESAFITALILALMLDPIQSARDAQFLGWVAILAMSSKYLLAWRKTHIFNPAAIAVVITAMAMHGTASWWIGTTSMVPAVLIGGWLIVRKLRQEEMALLFCGAALVTTCLLALVEGKEIAVELTQLLLQSPLFFFASIMLTEPLTAPQHKVWRLVYAALVGFLASPNIHVGGFYFTPEVALLVGNLVTFAVSPHTDPAIGERAHERGLGWYPGAATPTEIVTAWRHGARAVKVFPAAQLGGPAFLKQVLAPLDFVDVIPTGGIGVDDAADYLAAGAVAVRTAAVSRAGGPQRRRVQGAGGRRRCSHGTGALCRRCGSAAGRGAERLRPARGRLAGLSRRPSCDRDPCPGSRVAGQAGACRRSGSFLLRRHAILVRPGAHRRMLR